MTSEKDGYPQILLTLSVVYFTLIFPAEQYINIQGIISLVYFLRGERETWCKYFNVSKYVVPLSP